jgi:putative hydrolase of the HAD superfamily
MREYKNLFIDLDDTLWDTYRNNTECLEDIYAAYDFGRHYSSFKEFFDRYWPYNNMLWTKYRNGEIDRHTLSMERFRHMLAPMGVTDDDSSLKIEKHFLDLTTLKTGVVDGAIELCEYLRPKYKMYILSNGFREVQFKKLSNSGLAPYFDGIVLSEDAQAQKPSEKIFQYALSKTNSRLSESLMIGDSWDADIVGAKGVGMEQLWFNPYKFPHEGFDPTYEVNSLKEITDIL